MLVGAQEIATTLNAWNLRLFYSDRLVNADAVRRWAAAGRMPCLHGVGGHSGRPTAITQHSLYAWVASPQRCVKIGRKFCTAKSGVGRRG